METHVVAQTQTIKTCPGCQSEIIRERFCPACGSAIPQFHAPDPDSRAKPAGAPGLGFTSLEPVSPPENPPPDFGHTGSFGARRRLTWSRRSLIVITVALCCAIVGDWFMRNREMDQMVTAVERSEAIMHEWMEEAVRILNSSSTIAQTTTPEYVRLAQRLSEAAEQSAVDLIDAHDRVAGVSVLPWHRSLSKAQDRYLDHSNAWRDELERIAADPATLGDANPEISGSFLIAERAFGGAIPLVPLFGVADRVENIFEE